MSKVSKEYTHIFTYNFLNIQWTLNLQKVLEKFFPTIPSNAIYVGGVEGYFDIQNLQHASTYIVLWLENP